MKSVSVGILLSVLLISACGQIGTSSAYSGLGNACSLSFISDYNKIAMSFNKSEQVAHVQSFCSYYKGVVCKATNLGSMSFRDEETMINVDSKCASWKASLGI